MTVIRIVMVSIFAVALTMIASLNIWAGDSASGQAVQHSGQAASQAGASGAAASVAAGQVVSGAAAVPAASSAAAGLASGAAGNASAAAADALAAGASQPLPVAEETVTAGPPPDEALKDKAAPPKPAVQ